MSILKLPINFVTVLLADIKKHIIKTNEVIDTINLLEKNLIRTNLSTYEIAVKNGFIGTEKDWLNSLKPGIGDFVIGEIPKGIIDGINATFTTYFYFSINSLEVYVNGLRQKIIEDYQIINTNTIQLKSSIKLGELLLINYQK